VTHSARNSPLAMSEFESLLARSSLAGPIPADESVDVDERQVLAVVAASRINPTSDPTPGLSLLASRRAAEQIRPQTSKLVSWINRLEQVFAADGALLT